MGLEDIEWHVSTIVLHSGFTALKTLCTLLSHASPPQPLEATTFSLSIVLSFPERHRVEITQYVAFSDWHLPLSNIHLGFLHVTFKRAQPLFAA